MTSQSDYRFVALCLNWFLMPTIVVSKAYPAQLSDAVFNTTICSRCIILIIHKATMLEAKTITEGLFNDKNNEYIITLNKS